MKTQEQEVYELYSSTIKKFGEFHKCIFHLHTPASHDYYLYKEYEKTYRELTDDNLYSIAVEKGLFPYKTQLEYDKNVFESNKEFISYLLIVDKIIKSEIKTIVISDHNTIKGYDKLKKAVQIYSSSKGTYYPEIILGIEISCADLNHVVSIFDYKKKKDIEEFITEYIMTEESGTYLTSRDVIKEIYKIGGYSYIAHIKSSNLFNTKSLSMAYKKELLSLSELNLIGISEISQKDEVIQLLKSINKIKNFNFILDNDSHCIDDILNKVMWLKGTKGDFRIIKDLIRDYDITVSLDKPTENKKYIESIIIENCHNNFIIPTNKTDKYAVINFSPSLNCIIGGRGTGKSTILNMIQYILTAQIYTEEQLEMICKHSAIWLIYKFNSREYIVKLTPPQKESDSDDIMKYFKETPFGYITKKIRFDKDNVKQTTLKKYIEIFTITKDKNKKIKIEKFTGKAKQTLLKTLFKYAYSINELVNIASTDKLNSYIYELVSQNQNIKKIDYKKHSPNLQELIKNLDSIQKIKNLRTRNIEKVLSEYNLKNKNKLKITYFQNNFFDFEKLPINQGDFIKIDNTIYNIKSENIPYYFYSMSSELDFIQILRLMATCNVEELLNCKSLMNFQEAFTQKSVEEGRNIITTKNQNMILRRILEDIFNERNCEVINNLIKLYLENMDEFSLEFNVNSNQRSQKNIFRNVKQLSLGQKVVAMLTFILTYSDYSKDYTPLIIDQPEDNLDSQYIYDNLVEALKKVKNKRQVIIATHNSTIVTNAKTENVIVMKSDNQTGWIEKSGYPTEESILRSILNYLEGGKDSFNHKRNLYSEILDK